MRDDPLKNLAVVQAVKDFPGLFERDANITKEELDKLWNQVGNKVGLSGLCFVFSFLASFFNSCVILGIAARDRWRIIRGSYVRYLKNRESDAAAGRKEYYLAKYLEFLRPYVSFRESGSATSAATTPVAKANTSNSGGTTYTLREVSTRKRKNPSRFDEMFEEAEEEEETTVVEAKVEQGGEILIEEELEENTRDSLYCQETGGDGSGGLTYTLRSSDLTDNKIMQQNLIRYSGNSPPRSVEEEKNPDMMFFKSLLPQMSTWTKKQKNKLKVAILTAMDEIDDS